MERPTLALKPKAERRLRGGHVWVYSNEVDTDTTPLADLEPGAEALIRTHDGKPLGVFMVNPHALICARLISRHPKQGLTKSLLKRRLEQADALRQALVGGTSYRMVYGDSDGLPGLVIDRFGQDFVIQNSVAGMEPWLPVVVRLLASKWEAGTIWLKNDGKMREVEGLPGEVTCAHGEARAELAVEENGVACRFNVLEGQKTGWFFDHRNNRARLNALIQRLDAPRVLDVFSYVGGWGVQALAHGAAEVDFVDASEPALQWAGDNAEAVGGAHRLLAGNAFDVLKALCGEKERYDVVVLDPPALIPRRKDIRNGEQAYRRLNQLALRLVKPGGWLMTGSCSMHLERARLLDLVRAASREVDRDVRLVWEGHQGEDHPILPAVPETAYLKAMLFHVSLVG